MTLVVFALRMKETIFSLDSSEFPNTSSDGKTAKIFPPRRPAVAKGRNKTVLLTGYQTAGKRLMSAKSSISKHRGKELFTGND